MNDIVVYQSKSGDWIAKRKGGDASAPKGRGPSSIEAHGNLLEREAEAGLLKAERKVA